MHSYRHGFHAANHADVLKHAVFVHILDYFLRKDTPFHVVDTHAGAGIYDLQHAWSQQSGEADAGALRLVGQEAAAGAEASDATPALIERYLTALDRCQADYGDTAYPGSPWLALQMLRPADRLHLFETHPVEIDVLSDNLRQRRGTPPRQVTLRHTDGFSGLKALLPPPSRRGVVIMDPSYEDKRDYRHVVQSIKEGLQRFATGCYAIWHPMVQRVELNEMLRSLRRLPDTEWLHATLQVRQSPRDGLGLYGSGMFIINPPWTLREELDQALPWLRQQLGQDSHACVALTDAAQYQAGADHAAPAASGGAQRAPREPAAGTGAGRPQKKRSPSRR